MRLFKFMKQAHAQDFLDHGRFQIQKISYYQSLEDEPGTPAGHWIADPNDSRTRYSVKRLDFSSPIQKALIGKKLSNWMDIEDAYYGGISNVEFVDSMPDMYIFCTSCPPFEPARKAMCEDAPKKWRKDDCIEIKAAREFYQRLFFDGVILNRNGVKLKSLFRGAAMKKVAYFERNQNLFDSEFIPASWFDKDKIFEPQQECRIVFRLHDGVDEDGPLIIEVPGISDLLERRSVESIDPMLGGVISLNQWWR